MLLEKVKLTRQLMEEVDDQQIKIAQHQQYIDFKDSLEKESNTANEYVESYQSLKRHYPAHIQSPDFNNFTYKLRSLLQTFGQEPKKIKITNTFRDINSFNEQLKEEWLSLAKKESDEAIATLNNVVRVIGENKEIHQIIQSLTILAEKWPVDEQNISHFKRQCDNARLTLSELNASPEVQQFLQRVNDREATLADLNTEVMEWLLDNQIAQNLVISFK